MAGTHNCPRCGARAIIRSSWPRKGSADTNARMQCTSRACQHEWLTKAPATPSAHAKLRTG